MKATRKVVCWLAASLAAPVLAVAGGSEADSARSAADTKDSPVTAAVKTKLAAEHVGNIANIKVDADQDGIVWLSGSTPTQETADHAVETARCADGVLEVKSTIVVMRESK
jgi:hyperosmotically inducible periplasmic protein